MTNEHGRHDDMVISDTQLRVQYHLFVRGSQTGKFKGKDGCKGEELRGMFQKENESTVYARYELFLTHENLLQCDLRVKI